MRKEKTRVEDIRGTRLLKSSCGDRRDMLSDDKS